VTTRAAALARWCETGLAASAALFPPLLVLAARGAAPLAAFAGLCAAGLVASARPTDWRTLQVPALLFTLLVMWAALAALWSIVPLRSVILDLRLLGLFAAAIALAVAADRVAAPQRLAVALYLGIAVGIVLALTDFLTDGLIRRQLYVRHLGATQLNQFAAPLAILTLPLAALPACRGRGWQGLAVAALATAVVAILVDTGAKLGLAVAVPIAVLLYWRRRPVARILAVLSLAAILAAPLVLPRLAETPGLVAVGDTIKSSVGHRLLIWRFVGARIAERPLLGWGLDSSRAIPGGKTEFRHGQMALPLHPHDAALQVWLELGLPGAVLFALLAAWLWWRVAESPWPRLYAAASGGALMAATELAQEAYGIWQEWWIGSLALVLFLVRVMGRVARQPD
jgi:O-antigen ligase